MVFAWAINSTVQLYEWYLWTLSFSDPRVANWFLMSSPKYTLALALSYLTIVAVGPRLMRRFPPMELRAVLVLYNLFMTVLNACIVLELLYCALKLNYNWQCQAVSYSNNPYELRIAGALWWFYFSKLLEFADTFFFILRKKNRQLTFLHFYHHSTMFCLWWIGIKWVAGGSAFFAAFMNSLVHVPMYLYYGLTAAFPHVNFWWKRYLTVLQLIQFFVAMIQTGYGLYIDCPFPRWMGYTLIGYMISFIILFTNFYVHSYATDSKKKAIAKAKRDADSVVQNGDAAGDSSLAANGHHHHNLRQRTAVGDHH